MVVCAAPERTRDTLFLDLGRACNNVAAGVARGWKGFRLMNFEEEPTGVVCWVPSVRSTRECLCLSRPSSGGGQDRAFFRETHASFLLFSINYTLEISYPLLSAGLLAHTRSTWTENNPHPVSIDRQGHAKILEVSRYSPWVGIQREPIVSISCYPPPISPFSPQAPPRLHFQH